MTAILRDDPSFKPMLFPNDILRFVAYIPHVYILYIVNTPSNSYQVDDVDDVPDQIPYQSCYIQFTSHYINGCFVY